MVLKKPRIVIIGAGMAGVTAANRLYKSGVKKGAFEVCVVEGGNRIGGRINTSEFGGDRIELGATWIHGIEGSPVHKIAQEINSLESNQPWECMDGFLDDPITIAENGYVLNPSLVDPISNLFDSLMDFAQGRKKSIGNWIENGNRVEKGIGFENGIGIEIGKGIGIENEIEKGIGIEIGNGIENGNGIEKGIGIENGNGIGIEKGIGIESVGDFLEKGLECYWKMESRKEKEEWNGIGEWNRKSLEEAIFAMNENTQRNDTAANDLHNLDYSAEREYVMFPGEEITIAKGYSSIIESLASVLPSGLIQLNKKVSTIEWQPIGDNYKTHSRPVKIHFLDGTSMSADHVIVTVSLGVLKAGVFNLENDSGVFKFTPSLPKYKIESISRLGYGVVNKLFLKLNPDLNLDSNLDFARFPFLQMVFHKSDQLKNPKIPWWIRKTDSLSPIYKNSNVLLSWFAGEEALELEKLSDEVILDGVSTTIANFLPNGSNYGNVKFDKVLKSQWGRDPLFMGSYSYIAVGSSTRDMDSLAEPLPNASIFEPTCHPHPPPLQILFAGEATHRTHYSTTHGAYFSGLREANRLLQHYHCSDV